MNQVVSRRDKSFIFAADMEASELIKKVRKVEIKTRRLTRNLFAGGYHSAFKGLGMSFSEVRPYQFGDDVRNIDWNVTARSNEPYVKVYEEERELTLLLMVDVSGSSFFGSTGQWKQEVLTEICAVLAYSASGNHDKVGLLLFAEKPLLYIPPKKDRQQTLRIIRELLNVQPAARGTNLAAALQYVRNIHKKRCVCFILSDFMADNYEHALRITAARHDCIGILCWDPRERQLPDVALLQIQDAETGQTQWIDSTDPDLRRAYTKAFDERLNRTESFFRRASADLLSLCSTDAYTSALLHFFEQRAKK